MPNFISRWRLVPLLLCLGTCSFSDETVCPEALFQRAMIQETGEHNMEAAIDLYKKVIEQAGSDRLLASKARLRMGNCYERLQKVQEATEVYFQIVTDT